MEGANQLTPQDMTELPVSGFSYNTTSLQPSVAAKRSHHATSRGPIMKFFTESFIRSVIPTNKRQYISQGKGFTLLVQPSGVKTFMYKYTFNRKRKQLVLGHHRSGTMSMQGISLAQALSIHMMAHQLLTKGIDPGAPKDISFERFAILYLERSKVEHSESWYKACRRSLVKYVLPSWQYRPITEIKREDAVALLNRIAASAPKQTINISNAVRAVFNTAQFMGDIKDNPMRKLSQDVPSLKSAPRNRCFSDEEIKTAWESIIAGVGGEGVKRAFQMVLVTGQLPNDVLLMHRRDIKGEWWSVPAGATLAEGHMVFLTPLALELIGNAKGFIFPSSSLGNAYGVGIMSRLIRLPIDNQGRTVEPYYGLGRWAPSDLRHTVKCYLKGLGIPLDIVKAVLATSAEGVSKLGHKTCYAEKKAALLEWEAKLITILEIARLPEIYPTRPSFGL